jgi:hypothetical protein
MIISFVSSMENWFLQRLETHRKAVNPKIGEIKTQESLQTVEDGVFPLLSEREGRPSKVHFAIAFFKSSEPKTHPAVN